MDKAEDLYRHTAYEASIALIDHHSETPEAAFLLGRDYFMMGDFKKAVDYLTKASQAASSNSDYMDWLGRAYGKRAETSNPLLAPALANKARQAFERAVQLDTRNSEALSDLFDYYLEAPGFLGGGYDKAMGVAEKIAVINPAEGYFAKAELAKKRKEFGTAEQQLRQAINLAPRQVGRLIDLAKFLANQGRTRESDAVFVQAERLDPNAPKVWFAKADTLIKTRRNLDEAKALLNKYLQASITADDPPKHEATKLLKQAENGA